MSSYENTSKIKISANQLISNMICMNYDNNKKFGLLQFHSGYGKFYLSSLKGYSRKIINAQTVRQPPFQRFWFIKYCSGGQDFWSIDIPSQKSVIGRMNYNRIFSKNDTN